MNLLTPEQAGELDDHILHGRIIRGVKLLKESGLGTLPQALEFYTERYKQLRDSRPDEFTKTKEEYWEGFYS